jgi:hypothetical protein
MPEVGGFKHASVSDGTGLNVDNSANTLATSSFTNVNTMIQARSDRRERGAEKYLDLSYYKKALAGL